MKFLILFGLFCETVKCSTPKNVTVEVMFVISSEVDSWETTNDNFTTKEFFLEVFDEMKELYAQLSIDLILHDFAVQNDEKMFEPVVDRVKKILSGNSIRCREMRVKSVQCEHSFLTLSCSFCHPMAITLKVSHTQAQFAINTL